MLVNLEVVKHGKNVAIGYGCKGGMGPPCKAAPRVIPMYMIDEEGHSIVKSFSLVEYGNEI